MVLLDGLAFLPGNSTPPAIALLVAKKLEIMSSMVLKAAGFVLEFSLTSAYNPSSDVNSLFVIVTFGRVSSTINIS